MSLPRLGARPAGFILALALLGAVLPCPGLAQASKARTASPEVLAVVVSASQAGAAGDWTLASTRLAEALDLDPQDPDALYLSALAALRLRDDARASLAFLEAIGDGVAYRVYTALAARDLRASLLLRLGRPQEALGLLPAKAKAEDLLDPEYRRIRALAYLALAKPGEALKELSAAAGRFPEDPRFPAIFFRAFASQRPTDESRALAGVFLDRLTRLTDLDQDLGLAALPFVLDPEARRTLILQRRALGSIPVAGSLRALEYGIIGDEAAIAEVLAHKDLAAKDLAELQDLLGSAAGRASFAKALASFAGTLGFDRDGDGYAEEYAEYRGASLVAWRRDGDQDGTFEASLGFQDGLPRTLALSQAGLLAFFTYDTYPSVYKLELSELVLEPSFLGQPGLAPGPRKAGTDSFTFAPRAFLYAPISLRPFPSRESPVLFLPVPQALEAASKEAAAARALIVGSKTGLEAVLTSLEGGLPLRRERFVEGRLLAQLDYEGGRPGLEKVDSDFDGRFETLRAYRPGVPAEAEGLAWVKVDADGDGIYEYQETFGPKASKAWDFDHDGRIDAVETALPDGRLQRELSSRLDGSFDEVLVLSPQGSLLAFTRRGVALLLVQDANPALRWIGRKPFDLGSALPRQDGIFKAKSLRYRLVWVGPEAFAEVLP